MRKLLLTGLLLLSSISASPSQWGPDSNISHASGSAYISSGGSWGVAADGDSVYAVWWDNRVGNNEVFFNRSTDAGATWEGAQQLTDDPGSSGLTSIAVSAHIIHVIWLDHRMGNREVYYKRSTNGGATWSTDTSISPGGHVGPTTLAASGLDVHAGWDDLRDGNDEIYYNRSSDGGLTWGTALRLTNDPETSAYPSIAVSGSYVYMAWWDSRTGTNEIYYKISSDGGSTWGADTPLTAGAGYALAPSIAASGPTVSVTWHNGISNQDVYFRRSMDRGATWGPIVNLSNDSTLSSTPCIAAAGQNLHVVWYGVIDSTSQVAIFHSESADFGASWSPPAPIASNSVGVSSTAVAVSGTVLHLAWIDQREGSYQIYYKNNPLGNLPTVARELDAGWNLVSIPYLRPDYTATEIFPGATTGAYAFDGGYSIAETLTTGRGYWIKYPAGFSAPISGIEILVDTIDVANGWNLIGTIGVPVDPVAVESSPPGMIISPFYGYSGGYLPAVELLPGEGYWVKTDSGQLILSPPALSQKTGMVRLVDTGELPPPSPGGSGSTDAAFATGTGRIGSVFPNPFNPKTVIQYSLTHDAYVDLKIVNILGEVVAMLVADKQTAGDHTSVWDAEGAPSGIYFCRLMVGGEIRTTKLLKLQ